jgi:hypothetical protein
VLNLGIGIRGRHDQAAHACQPSEYAKQSRHSRSPLPVLYLLPGTLFSE